MYCHAAADEKIETKPLVVDVGYVTDAHIYMGCGCAYYFSDKDKEEREKIIFKSNFEDTAWMHLNGKDVKLKRIEESESEGSIKKGRRSYEIYQYGDMTIKFDYLLTWTCESDAPNDDSCEIWYYDINITFTQKGQHKTVKAKGECGC